MCKQAVDRRVLFGSKHFLPRIPSALFWLSYQQQLWQEIGVCENYNENWLLSNLSSANSEYDKTYYRSVVIVVVFETNSRHAKCMQRLLILLFLPQGREANMEQTISVSLVTVLDSLDIMSDTKEQDHMTSKSAFLSCEKIFSHFEEGGGNFDFLLFCCYVRGRSWPRNLSFGPLLLVITSHD